MWLDDYPETIENYQKILESEGSDFDIDITCSIEEASKKLATEKYAALVVDCKLDQYNRYGERTKICYQRRW